MVSRHTLRHQDKPLSYFPAPEMVNLIKFPPRIGTSQLLHLLILSEQQANDVSNVSNETTLGNTRLLYAAHSVFIQYLSF